MSVGLERLSGWSISHCHSITPGPGSHHDPFDGCVVVVVVDGSVVDGGVVVDGGSVVVVVVPVQLVLADVLDVRPTVSFDPVQITVAESPGLSVTLVVAAVASPMSAPASATTATANTATSRRRDPLAITP